MKDSKSIKADTLDFIFEYIKDAPEKQLLSAERLDNKVIQILSVATILIGLIGLAVDRTKINNIMIIPLIFIVLSYVAVVVVSSFHLRAKTFHRSVHADTLWNKCWNSEIIGIKHSLVTDIAKAYKYNKNVLYIKTKTLYFSLVALGIEGFLIGILILFSFLVA